MYRENPCFFPLDSLQSDFYHGITTMSQCIRPEIRFAGAETIPAINEVDTEGGSSYGRPSALSAALGTSLGTSPADVRRRTYN